MKRWKLIQDNRAAIIEIGDDVFPDPEDEEEEGEEDEPDFGDGDDEWEEGEVEMTENHIHVYVPSPHFVTAIVAISLLLMAAMFIFKPVLVP